MGVTLHGAKYRRNRAVAAGYLSIESPGRWKGSATRYRLLSKGQPSDPLSGTQKGNGAHAKGATESTSKGQPSDPRTFINVQEKGGADGLGAAVPPPRVSCSRCGSFRFLGGYRDSKPVCHPCLAFMEREAVSA